METTTRKRKTYAELEFTDDFMFCKIMQSNPDICKDILELILEIRIDRILQVDTQDVLSVSSDAHGVRLDVKVIDTDGRIFNIEMQTTDKRDIPQRSRYYQGTIDVTSLKPGQQYTDLPDSFVIFICTFDPLGDGLAKYTFREYCEENKDICLETGATKIIVNAKGATEGLPEDMKAFLNYLIEHRAESDLTTRIEDKVLEAKRYLKWERDYMLFEEKLREERELGRQEGIEQGTIRSTLQFYADGDISAERAAEKLSVDVAELPVMIEQYGIMR